MQPPHFSKLVEKQQHTAPPFFLAPNEAFVAQLLATKFWPAHARPPSYDVIMVTMSDHFLREIADYCTFEDDIDHAEDSFDHIR